MSPWMSPSARGRAPKKRQLPQKSGVSGEGRLQIKRLPDTMLAARAQRPEHER